MEVMKWILTALILFAATIFAQPIAPPPPGPGNLKEALGLNDSQIKKMDKIFKDSKQKIEKLRKRENAIIESYRDSTKYIFDNSNEEILKILNKDQAEKFKHITVMKDRGEIPPPPGMPGNNIMPGRDERGPQQNIPGECCRPPCFHNERRPNPRIRIDHSSVGDENMFPDLEVLEMLLEQDETTPPDTADMR